MVEAPENLDQDVKDDENQDCQKSAFDSGSAQETAASPDMTEQFNLVKDMNEIKQFSADQLID